MQLNVTNFQAQYDRSLLSSFLFVCSRITRSNLLSCLGLIKLVCWTLPSSGGCQVSFFGKWSGFTELQNLAVSLLRYLKWAEPSAYLTLVPPVLQSHDGAGECHSSLTNKLYHCDCLTSMTESKMGKRQCCRNKCFCCLSSKSEEKLKPFLLSSWSHLRVCGISLLFFKFSAWTRRSSSIRKDYQV